MLDEKRVSIQHVTIWCASAYPVGKWRKSHACPDYGVTYVPHVKVHVILIIMCLGWKMSLHTSHDAEKDLCSLLDIQFAQGNT